MRNNNDIDIRKSQKVLTIAWNRPEKKNALTQAMYAQAAQALEEANNNTAIRVLMLKGTQDCFTSGNDIGDFLDHPATDSNSPVARFLKALVYCEKPLIAAVNGPAIGIGVTMLLHCDIVVAADSTLFSLPFTKLGLCPEGASSYLLPQLIGHQHAAELLLLGESFDAQRAYEYGLINRLVSAEDYQAVATTLALQLAAMPPQSMRVTKALMKQGQKEKLDSVLAAEFESFSRMLDAEEAKEALAAFMERRKPNFSSFE